jgi:signal transduction histidine kinase
MQELFDIQLFDDATDEELAWIVANSEVVELATGDYFVREGETRNQFYVVLEGELQISRMHEGALRVFGTTPRGIIGNEQSLLYARPSLVNSQALMPSRLLLFDLAAFREMFTRCPTVGTRVLRVAAERTQGVAGLLVQQEKMAALGKLSAGLAHELNNPAAAARRATRTLHDLLPTLQHRTLQLCGQGMAEAQFAALLDFVNEISGRPPVNLSPLDRSDREGDLGDWLELQGLEDGWDLAPALVDAGLTQAELETLVATLPQPAIPAVLGWLNLAFDTAGLLTEIEQSATRISELVGAVKSYTYMDQAPLQEVDLHQGLDNTVTVLQHKLKHLNLLREYDPALPTIMARGGELNQVWTNLIDNAIDAMDGQGTIQLITRHEQEFVMVEIADDGPGIPSEVLPRIFEPFFTTKDVGVGTGLGLDISYRIIQQHNGTVEVHSQPGRTRFIVRLPIGG